MPITIIDKIKPKNNNNFYLIDIEDIEFEGKNADIKIKELIDERKIYHLDSEEPLNNLYNMIWFDNSNYTNDNNDSNSNELKAIISNLIQEINLLKSRVEFLELYGSNPILPDTDDSPYIYLENNYNLLLENNMNILLENYSENEIDIDIKYFFTEDQKQIILENNNYLLMEVQ